MQERRIFSHDPEWGVTKWWHYDSDTDIARIETVQDVEHLLEVNKAAQALTAGGRWGDGLQHVAHIPMATYAEWLATGKDKDQAAVRRWLNDPENKLHRTKLGKV